MALIFFPWRLAQESVSKGKIVEHWGVVDGTGVMQQLGLMPG
jgi:predicted ester cyclase